MKEAGLKENNVGPEAAEAKAKSNEPENGTNKDQKELKPTGYRKKRRQNKNKSELVITLGVFLGLLLVGALIVAAYYGNITSDEDIAFNGLKYSGNVRNGEPHGTGVLIFEDGTEHFSDDIVTIRNEDMKFVGELKDGKQNGKGFLIKDDGRKYAGDFSDGLMHGEGTFYWPDGTVYKGDYRENKREGEGELISPDGTKYVGGFKNNQKHGEGVLISPEGIKQTGTWEEGEKQ